MKITKVIPTESFHYLGVEYTKGDPNWAEASIAREWKRRGLVSCAQIVEIDHTFDGNAAGDGETTRQADAAEIAQYKGQLDVMRSVLERTLKPRVVSVVDEEAAKPLFDDMAVPLVTDKGGKRTANVVAKEWIDALLAAPPETQEKVVDALLAAETKKDA